MYRDDLAALAARHSALESEVAHKRRELDQATALLDEARGVRRLPVLANIRVASPCKAAWAEMTGDDRVRHCGACKKNVYNLSEMTRDEAEALIFAHEGRLCVRYYQRKDGTILFGDCWIGAQRNRRMRAAALAVAGAFAGAAVATQMATELAHIHDADASAVSAGDFVMGDIGEYQGGLSIDLPIESERDRAVREARDVIRNNEAGEMNGGFTPMSLAGHGRPVKPAAE